MPDRAGRKSKPDGPRRLPRRGRSLRAAAFPRSRIPRRDVRAFTLIEALVAVALAALAASVLLAGLSSSLQTTDEALKRTIAAGMAEQLLDEIVGTLYFDNVDNDPYQTVLGRTSWENQGQGRERYNDIDDYHGIRTRPPTDLWGIPLGRDNGQGGQRHAAFRASPEFLQSWQQRVDVYYVAENNFAQRLPAGVTSNFRAVEVLIVDNSVGGRELARLRRVVAYVPPPE